jgi:hypothetical protein
MAEKITKQMLIQQAIDASTKLGRTPSYDEFKSMAKRGGGTIQRLFGSYINLLMDAGLQDHRTSKALTKNGTIPQTPNLKFPDPLDDDLPVEDLLDIRCARFEKRKKHDDAKKWSMIKVDSDLPIGINVFGDPHLDDDGCNLPLLRRDVEICKNTPGMFAANIGDTTNNWVGRLMCLYADQSTTRSEAWKYVEWFFFSGMQWLFVLMGNHDTWNFGAETLKRITKNICDMTRDWRAQFVLEFSNGVRVNIDAAHDHKGHSQWNALHAQQKASMMGGIAHVYIAGHRHNWAIAHHECPHTNRIYCLARARGYKEIDDFARLHGFGEQKFGASVTIIIDPRANELNRVRCFADLEEAAQYLTYLRAKYAKI